MGAERKKRSPPALERSLFAVVPTVIDSFLRGCISLGFLGIHKFVRWLIFERHCKCSFKPLRKYVLLCLSHGNQYAVSGVFYLVTRISTSCPESWTQTMVLILWRSC